MHSHELDIMFLGSFFRNKFGEVVLLAYALAFLAGWYFQRLTRGLKIAPKAKATWEKAGPPVSDHPVSGAPSERLMDPRLGRHSFVKIRVRSTFCTVPAE